MSVIPTIYNQGTGLIGSTTEGNNLPENVQNLIVEETLTVLGTTDLVGDTTVQSNLTVNNILTAQDLVINGTVNINDINVENADVNNNLTVGNTTTTEILEVSTDATITNDLNVNNETTTNELVVTTNATVQNNLEVNNTLTAENVNVNDTLTTLNLDVTGTATINTIEIQDLEVEDATVNNNLTVLNDVDVSNKITTDELDAQTITATDITAQTINTTDITAQTVTATDVDAQNVTTNTLEVDTTITANNLSTIPASDPTLRPLVVYNPADGILRQTSTTGAPQLYFQESTNTLTVSTLELRFLSTSQSNSNFPILLRNSGNLIVGADITGGGNLEFGYNPGTNTLNCANAIFLGDITVDGTIFNSDMPRKLLTLVNNFFVQTNNTTFQSIIGSGADIIGSNALPTDLEAGSILNIISYGVQGGPGSSTLDIILNVTVGNANTQFTVTDIPPPPAGPFPNYRIDCSVLFYSVGAAGEISINLKFITDDNTVTDQIQIFDANLPINTNAGGSIGIGVQTSLPSPQQIQFEVTQSFIRKM